MVGTYTIDYGLVGQSSRVGLRNTYTKAFTTKSNREINSLRYSGFLVTSPLYSGEVLIHQRHHQLFRLTLRLVKAYIA